MNYTEKKPSLIFLMTYMEYKPSKNVLINFKEKNNTYNIKYYYLNSRKANFKKLVTVKSLLFQPILHIINLKRTKTSAYSNFKLNTYRRKPHTIWLENHSRLESHSRSWRHRMHVQMFDTDERWPMKSI